MKEALPASNDGCLQPPASMSKEASAVVYLMEELGDARLRCDQLVRYLEEGAKLIQGSSHKDHFFEVAGHLIQAVPVTTFKLQKALQAVALAASKIDYEELKRELRPEKVQELERVLEDVRIRQIQRRAPLQVMTPKRTAEYLRTMAQMSREAGGVMPYTAMASLILALEDRTKEASEPASDALDKLAESLERAQGSDEAPSRTVLAAVLRRMLGDANVEGYENVKEAERDMSANIWKADRTALTIGEGDKRTRHEEGKKMTPEEVTKGMSEEEAKKWKENTEKHRDKFKDKDAADWKAAATPTMADMDSLVEWLEAPWDEMMGSRNSLLFVRNWARKEGEKDVEQAVSDVEDAALSLSKAASKIKRFVDPNLRQRFYPGSPPVPYRIAADDEKRTMNPEGKKMTPEEVTKGWPPEKVKEWKENTEKHRDKFKDKDAANTGELQRLLKEAFQEGASTSADPDYAARELPGVLGAVIATVRKIADDPTPVGLLSKLAAHMWELAYWKGASHDYGSRAADWKAKDARYKEDEDADKDNDGDPDNIKDEAAQKKWKENTQKYKDKFKDKKAVSSMSLGKWYMQSFSGGDKTYFVPTAQQKNKGWKGLNVDVDGASGRSRKAKQISVHPTSFQLWKEVPEKDIPKGTLGKLKARMASEWKVVAKPQDRGLARIWGTLNDIASDATKEIRNAHPDVAQTLREIASQAEEAKKDIDAHDRAMDKSARRVDTPPFD